MKLPEAEPDGVPGRAPFFGELPEDVSPFLRRVLDAVAWPLHEKRSNGKLHCLVLRDPCPACATVVAPDREPARARSAYISPLAGALRCWRARCPATGDGLPLVDWLPRFAPRALVTLAESVLAARCDPQPSGGRAVTREATIEVGPDERLSPEGVDRKCLLHQSARDSESLAEPGGILKGPDFQGRKLG
jgi:hypothetical protein